MKLICREINWWSVKNTYLSRFILVSTAFLFLQGKNVGIVVDKDINDDISHVVNLKLEIDSYFDSTVSDFLAKIEQLQQRTANYLRDIIISADSSSNLKSLLDYNIT